VAASSVFGASIQSRYGCGSAYTPQFTAALPDTTPDAGEDKFGRPRWGPTALDYIILGPGV
jgi:hypothetical protein